MKRVLFVDIGGVCCENPYIAMSEELHRMFGVSGADAMKVLFREAVPLDLGRQDFVQFHAKVVSELGLPLNFSQFESLHESCLRLKDDVIHLLSEVRGRNGLRVVALSNIPAYTWKLLDKKFSISALFDDAVLSYQHRVGKPDPAIFEIALRRAGIDATDALFIDDRKENVEEAEKEGIDSVLFTTVEMLRKDLSDDGILVS